MKDGVLPRRGIAPRAKYADEEGSTPRDFPAPGGPHRVYVAVTNHCNRACPWCSTCSSPAGDSWLSMEGYIKSFPDKGPFEIHLEGGEPTLHPLFRQFIAAALADPRCVRVMVCANGSTIPQEAGEMGRWVDSLGGPVAIKLSINHHLLERGPGLMDLAVALARVMEARGLALVINVRLRKGVAGDDAAVRSAVREAGLLPLSNVFFLRRYGLAANEMGWDPPILVGDNFRMVNPDGAIFGPDLTARSEAMRRLP